MKASTLFKMASHRIRNLTMVVAFSCALLLPAFALYANDFIVTLLGTGSPIPSLERLGNSTLIEVGGQRLVFDMGRGVTIRLWQKQIPLGSIDAHFLTHLHS